ncbi:MAG: hypothetical protein Athens041674_432 [Parcubacteria group bacterium Athens0416_74]|nr:MAG: hypothetical protein Athens041674_432 [Parcubacteria group bacterium Athens0416_74]
MVRIHVPQFVAKRKNWRNRKRIDALPYGFEARSDVEPAGEAARAGPGDHLAATAAMMSRRGIHVPQSAIHLYMVESFA